MKKVVIHPDFEFCSDFIEHLPDIFHTEGKTIYKDRNEVKVFEVNGIQINVKQYKVPIFPNRIIYTFFRSTKAYRAYTKAFELIYRDIETPRPIAYIIFTQEGLIHQCYFISLQSPCTRNMYEFGKGSLKERESILRRFARYTARLHDAGVYHHDFSPGNILFQQTENEVKFTLVDINRLQFRSVSVKKGCANFARLWGSQEMFRLIAEEYAVARNSNIDYCTHWVFFYRKRFWKKFARKHGIPFNPEYLTD